MRLNCIVVYDMNRNDASQRDVHCWPRTANELASVESDIHPFVGHHDDEVGSARRHVRGTGPTVGGSEPEEVKRIRRSKKTGDCYDHEYDHQNSSQESCLRGLFPARTPRIHSVSTILGV